MAPQPLVTVPGVELYRDGIRYEVSAGGLLSRLISLRISQEGFAPIEHVNAVEVAEVRSLDTLIFALVTIPLIIGVLFLLLWMFTPKTVLRIHSEGEDFITVILSKRHRPQALQFVETYRKLKHSLASRAAQQAQVAA